MAMVKMLPNNLQAEEAVLGSLFIDPDAIWQIAPVLNAADFYDPKHRYIYKAMQSVSNRGDRIDLLTLNTELENIGRLDAVGGSAFVMRLTEVVPSALACSRCYPGKQGNQDALRGAQQTALRANRCAVTCGIRRLKCR